ncbi:MAG: amidohydrolase family protein [Anaerotignaceae bacterium]
MKIIDGHIHFRPDIENFNPVAERSGHINSEEHLREAFLKNNIVYAIVMGNLSMEVTDHKYPHYMGYCIGLDSSTFVEKPMEYFIEKTEENFKQKNCVGIKLYPGYCHNYVYDEMYEPFYELAKKYNKPVAIHTGAVASTSRKAFLKYSHPLTIDEVAVNHPDVQFVMCHFGNPWLVDAATVIEKNKNVSTDISGILEGCFNVKDFCSKNKEYVKTIKMWLDYIGDYSRIIYGTDWPIVNIENYIEFCKEIIPKEHHQKVFYDNAKRVYRLDI